jgi:hypothetical protein
MLQRAVSYLTAPPARLVTAESAHLGVSVRPTDLGLSATGEDDGATAKLTDVTFDHPSVVTTCRPLG